MNDLKPENTDQADKKAPIIWTTTILFSLTAITALTLVPWYGFTEGYSTGAWLTAFIFLVCNGLSITGGYHRLWSHSAYKAHPILKWFYALWGACNLQNSILIWASGHRRHHRHVDSNEKDPYSAQRGFWFSHIGWMLRSYPSGAVNLDNVKDLQRDKIVIFQHNYYLPLVLLMNVGMPLLVGAIIGDIWGTLLLAGLLRLVVNHHTTFFINSLAHIWGSQPYTDENSARDNGIIAFFTYGEGYHNYHHIFQTDYRNGIRWYQFDPTKWMILICSWFGLASQLTRVPHFKVQRAILAMQFKRAQQKLIESSNADNWKELLESEYEQFKDSLQQWRNLQQDWYEAQRQVLQEKWETASVRTRFKELEYSLKMQQKRLQLLTAQFA